MGKYLASAVHSICTGPVNKISKRLDDAALGLCCHFKSKQIRCRATMIRSD